MKQRKRGYTLYELLMTLALVGIVLATGLPAFSGTLARQRQAVEINALFHSIHLARKESIMRRKVVSLCPSPDGLTCSPGRDWSAGWIMFENADRDSPPQVDPASRYSGTTGCPTMCASWPIDVDLRSGPRFFEQPTAHLSSATGRAAFLARD